MVPVYDAAAFARTLQLLAGGRRLHIISRGTRWALTRENADRALRVFDTKVTALRYALPYLATGYDIVVHHRDGMVEEWLKADATAVGAKKSALAEPTPKAKPTARKAPLKASASQKATATRNKPGSAL